MIGFFCASCGREPLARDKLDPSWKCLSAFCQVNFCFTWRDSSLGEWNFSHALAPCKVTFLTTLALMLASKKKKKRNIQDTKLQTSLFTFMYLQHLLPLLVKGYGKKKRKTHSVYAVHINFAYFYTNILKQALSWISWRARNAVLRNWLWHSQYLN